MTAITWAQNPRLPRFLDGEPGGYVIDVRRRNDGYVLHCNVSWRVLPIGYLESIAVDVATLDEAKAIAETHYAKTEKVQS